MLNSVCIAVITVNNSGDYCQQQQRDGDLMNDAAVLSAMSAGCSGNYPGPQLEQQRPYLWQVAFIVCTGTCSTIASATVGGIFSR